jgi:hypothetical protein
VTQPARAPRYDLRTQATSGYGYADSRGIAAATVIGSVIALPIVEHATASRGQPTHGKCELTVQQSMDDLDHGHQQRHLLVAKPNHRFFYCQLSTCNQRQTPDMAALKNLHATTLAQQAGRHVVATSRSDELLQTA